MNILLDWKGLKGTRGPQVNLPLQRTILTLECLTSQDYHCCIRALDSYTAIRGECPCRKYTGGSPQLTLRWTEKKFCVLHLPLVPKSE